MSNSTKKFLSVWLLHLSVGIELRIGQFFNLIILVESLFAPDQTWVHFCETFSCYFCPIVQCILYYICVQCLCVKRPLSLFCVCEILRRRLLCNKSEGCLFNFGRCSQNRLSTKRNTVGWNWFQRSFITLESGIDVLWPILKVVSSTACHAGDWGSIPRQRAIMTYTEISEYV